MGDATYQLVQDFFHQQWEMVQKWWKLLQIIHLDWMVCGQMVILNVVAAFDETVMCVLQAVQFQNNLAIVICTSDKMYLNQWIYRLGWAVPMEITESKGVCMFLIFRQQWKTVESRFSLETKLLFEGNHVFLVHDCCVETVNFKGPVPQCNIWPQGMMGVHNPFNTAIFLGWGAVVFVVLPVDFHDQNPHKPYENWQLGQGSS